MKKISTENIVFVSMLQMRVRVYEMKVTLRPINIRERCLTIPQLRESDTAVFARGT